MYLWEKKYNNQGTDECSLQGWPQEECYIYTFLLLYVLNNVLIIISKTIIKEEAYIKKQKTKLTKH